MRLFLSLDIQKGGAGSGGGQSGDLRGGQYAARAVIGSEKDGTPRYKYFKTKEEYDQFLKNHPEKAKQRSPEDTQKRTEKDSKQSMKHNLLLLKKKPVKKSLSKESFNDIRGPK